MSTGQRKIHHILVAALWVGAAMGAVAAIEFPQYSDAIRAVMLLVVSGAITVTLAGAARIRETCAAELWEAGYRAGKRSERV